MTTARLELLSMDELAEVVGGGFQGALPDYYGSTFSLAEVAQAQAGCQGGVFYVEGNSSEGYGYGCIGAPPAPWGDGPGQAFSPGDFAGAPSPYIGDEAVYEPSGGGGGDEGVGGGGATGGGATDDDYAESEAY